MCATCTNVVRVCDWCVSSGVPLGTLVTTVTATDTDVNHLLNYYFREPGGNEGSVFSISAYTGRITVARELDYERQSFYKVMVEVSDTNYTAATEVHIHVDDVNDNAPVFSQSSYQVRVTCASRCGHAH